MLSNGEIKFCVKLKYMIFQFEVNLNRISPRGNQINAVCSQNVCFAILVAQISNKHFVV